MLPERSRFERRLPPLCQREPTYLTARCEPPLDCLDWRTGSKIEKGHGRLSSRMIQVSTELTDFLARDWYGVEQVFCLRRQVEYPLKCKQEYVYGITSLTPKQAGPLCLLELIRDHWSIEIV